MAASYPGTKRDFPTHINVTEVIDASHMNEVQDEITALQATVGTNPHISTAGGGSSLGAWSGLSRTYTTLSDRLANIEAGHTADTHTQYVRFSGTETITGTKTFSAASTTFGTGVGSDSATVYVRSGTTGGSTGVYLQDGTTNRWALYRVGATSELYVRDMVNARQQTTYTPGTTALLALTQVHSRLTVDSNTVLSGTLSVTGATTLAATTATTLALSGALTLAAGTGVTPAASAVGDTALGGTSTDVARADHRHAREVFSATAPVASTAGGASAVGTSVSPARSDHAHGLAAGVVPTTSALGAVAAEGSSTAVARADHVHGREAFGATITTITPQSTASAAGTATTPARSDHVHGNAAPVTPSNSAVGAAAAIGSSTAFALGDHVHGREAFGAAPPAVTVTAGTAGAATTLARSDHNHSVTVGSPVAENTFGGATADGTSTSLARADHRHGTPPAPTAASVGAVALVGDTMTGALRVGTAGNVRLQPGTATNAGYIEFYSTAAASRQGYIGYSTTTAALDAGTVPYIAGTHAFTGAITSTGTITENGNRVYSAANPQPISLASTVVGETTYGLASVVGTSSSMARADHSHGSPATPVTSFATSGNLSVNAATGAVTLTMTATPTFTSATIPTLSGNTTVSGTLSSSGNLSTTGTGQIIENGNRVYSAANPQPLSLASTVAAETTYGLASVVGTSTSMARADHVHGSPATPVTSLATSGNLSVNAATGAVTVTMTATPTFTSATIPTLSGATTVTGALSASGNLSTTGTGQILEQGNRVYSAANPQPLSLASTVGASTAFAQASAVGTSTSLARADHVHGTPATPVTTLAASGNLSVNASTGAVTVSLTATPTFTSATIPTLSGATTVTGTLSSSGNLSTTGTGQILEQGARVYSANNPPPVAMPVVIMPFFVGGSVGVGLRRPEFIATVPMTIRGARSRSYAGSGTYQVYVNGASVSGTATTFDITQRLHDFTDVNINAGDRVQINVATATTDAVDLSVTVDVVTR